jgi:hypothetical protein
MAIANALNTQLTGTTGTDMLVGSTSPTLTTPILGIAVATTINKVIITTPVTSATLTIIDGKTLTCSNTLTLTATDGSSVAFGTGGTVLYNSGALGTPVSGTLTNCTDLPISTGVSGLGTGIATFLATPSSANLIAAVTDETGTGALVFGTSPVIATPLIVGIIDASLAAAGNVGQIISSTVAIGSALSLTTDTPLNVTSISLTAGDWDVYGQIVFIVNGATTIASYSAAINTTSATLPIGSTINACISQISTTFTTGQGLITNPGACNINVNSTTTVYLVAQLTFAVNTAAAYGAIWARRRR